MTAPLNLSTLLTDVERVKELDRATRMPLLGTITDLEKAMDVRDVEFRTLAVSLAGAVEQLVKASTVTADTSDGYHTFRELYEYRRLYNAALFNEWAIQGRYDVHKSRRHSDGEPCFGGGWFIVVAQLPIGQISNHYKDEYWGLFDVPELERAREWDGHTPAIVAERLAKFLASWTGGKA